MINEVAFISPRKILNSLTQGCFVPSLKDIGQVVLQKTLSVFNVFLLFGSHFPSEKARGPSFEQT